MRAGCAGNGRHESVTAHAVKEGTRETRIHQADVSGRRAKVSKLHVCARRSLGAMTHLVVHILYRAEEDSAQALSLARQAPIFTMEGIGAQRVASGLFPSLPVDYRPGGSAHR